MQNQNQSLTFFILKMLTFKIVAISSVADIA